MCGVVLVLWVVNVKLGVKREGLKILKGASMEEGEWRENIWVYEIGWFNKFS